jgi:hypothetical protein
VSVTTDPRHFTQLAKRLLAGKVTPFLGAGVNLAGRPDGDWEAGGYLPSGGELAAYLAERSDCPADDAADLLRVSQYIEVRLGEADLYEALHDLFAAERAPMTVHTFLAGLVPVLRGAGARQQVIVTTNYDRLLEAALAAAGEEFDLIWYEAKKLDPNRGRFFHRAPSGEEGLIDRPNEWAGIDLATRPVVLKLHGAIGGSPETGSFVITEDNYIDYLALGDVSNQIPMVLLDPMLNSHFVFMGYSLRDWNLRVVLNRIWGQRKLERQSWSVQLGATELEKALWSERRVDIIPEDLLDYLEALRAAVEACAVAKRAT